MPASKTQLIKSVLFTPAGGQAITISGVESVSYRKNGEVVKHHTDATLAISAHFFDGLEGEVGVRVRDASQLALAGLQPGTVGVLVVTYQQRAKGTGAVAGQDKTVTAAQAMVGNHEGQLPHVDRGELDIPFHCSDDAGLNPFAYA